MSRFPSRRPRITSRCASIRPERRSPPSAFGRASPCSRASLRQRLTLAALTPKRAPAALWLRPAETDDRNTIAKIKGKGFRHLSRPPQPGQHLEAQITRTVNPRENPNRFNQIRSRSNSSYLTVSLSLWFKKSSCPCLTRASTFGGRHYTWMAGPLCRLARQSRSSGPGNDELGGRGGDRCITILIWNTFRQCVSQTARASLPLSAVATRAGSGFMESAFRSGYRGCRRRCRERPLSTPRRGRSGGGAPGAMSNQGSLSLPGPPDQLRRPETSYVRVIQISDS